MNNSYNLKKNNIYLVNSQIILIKILAKGDTISEISAQLNLSHNTIKTRIQKLYKTFNVHNRKDLIQEAIKNKIITTKDIKPKFRKRFIKIQRQALIPNINCELTPEELIYLKLVAVGMSQKNIIKYMPLSGIYHARVIANCICYRLNAKNITQAVKISYILKYLNITLFFYMITLV